jgi:predicted nucleic acid-binding protein
MDAGDPAVIQRFESAEEIWLPLIALGELYAGFELGDRKDQNEEQLSDFLSQPTVDVLYPNEDTALQHGEIFAHLRRQGTPIPTNDIWIAGLALQYDLTLDTRDDHIKRVPGLKLHS